MCGLITGATYPMRAVALFWQKPRLLGYLVTPLILNLVLGIGLYLGLFSPSWQWLNQVSTDLIAELDIWIAQLPAWLQFLSNFSAGLGIALRVIFCIVLLIVVGFLFAQFGALLGSPWYGKLSEQIERLRTQSLVNIEVGLFADIGRALQFELKKLLFAVCVGFCCLLLNVVPGLGSLAATIGGVGLGATLVCLDFLDAPLERRRLSFRHKLSLIYRNLPATGSFGLVCLFLVSIPLLNLITVPICVASGTLFFCDRLWPKYFHPDQPPQDKQS